MRRVRFVFVSASRPIRSVRSREVGGVAEQPLAAGRRAAERPRRPRPRSGAARPRGAAPVNEDDRVVVGGARDLVAAPRAEQDDRRVGVDRDVQARAPLGEAGGGARARGGDRRERLARAAASARRRCPPPSWARTLAPGGGGPAGALRVARVERGRLLGQRRTACASAPRRVSCWEGGGSGHDGPRDRGVQASRLRAGAGAQARSDADERQAARGSPTARERRAGRDGPAGRRCGLEDPGDVAAAAEVRGEQRLVLGG